MAPTPAEFAGLAEQLDQVWNDPRNDTSLKKQAVRILIQEVVADVESSASEIVLVIHWKVVCRRKYVFPSVGAGTTTATQIMRSLKPFHCSPTSVTMI